MEDQKERTNKNQIVGKLEGDKKEEKEDTAERKKRWRPKKNERKEETEKVKK